MATGRSELLTTTRTGSPNPREALRAFAGPPRSLVWRGGAAHLRFEGEGRKAPDLHSHFGIQLSVGLVEALSLSSRDCTPERLAPGWLVGSDRPHWMRGRGAGVTIFWDPLLDGGRRIANRLHGADVLALSAAECEAIQSELEGCWQRNWRLADVRAAADRIVNRLAPDAAPDLTDRRVRTVIAELVMGSDENVGLADLAARVGLSESRLAHLFRRNVGIPIRQYRLSLRMEQAVRYISRGSSLTEAAHMSGFSDSAHFSRICRRMFGSAPSDLPDFEIER